MQKVKSSRVNSLLTDVNGPLATVAPLEAGCLQLATVQYKFD
jgi:hypothetical protein